jgi:hypothetical protein
MRVTVLCSTIHCRREISKRFKSFTFIVYYLCSFLNVRIIYNTKAIVFCVSSILDCSFSFLQGLFKNTPSQHIVIELYKNLFYTSNFTEHAKPIFSRVRVTQSLILCVSFVDRNCLFVLFLLAIVLSVLLRFTDSDYPLVTSNSS